jgi:hypothetical protein
MRRACANWCWSGLGLNQVAPLCGLTLSWSRLRYARRMRPVQHVNTSPVRGNNPKPSSGWPWSLTDYEVAYITAFNARPVREDGWAGDTSAEVRLDQEAEGVRRTISTPKASWWRLPVGRRWPWITAWLVLLAAAVVFTTLATLQMVDAGKLQATNSQLGGK